MKMTKEHFSQLEKDVDHTLWLRNIQKETVTTSQLAWNVFHTTKNYWLYHHYNDANIGTALKKIFKL